jgi:RES domain-containing protein
MILWRISNHASLDGRGGLQAPGRWHSRGSQIVYLADTPAAALLETLVHLELDYADLPPSYKLLKIEVPDDVAVMSLELNRLPPDWNTNLVATQALGDEWLAGGQTALLRVPSAVAPESWNVLLNPRHADAARARIVAQRQYPWDRRLLR